MSKAVECMIVPFSDRAHQLHHRGGFSVRFKPAGSIVTRQNMILQRRCGSVRWMSWPSTMCSAARPYLPEFYDATQRGQSDQLFFDQLLLEFVGQLTRAPRLHLLMQL